MSCTCHKCKKTFKTDLVVTDHLWAEIYTLDPEKSKQGGGLLCPCCIIKKLEDLGYYSYFDLRFLKK